MQPLSPPISIPGTRTILDYLRTNGRFSTPYGVLTSQVLLHDTPVLAVGLDNGNDAAKVALLTPQGYCTTARIPTAYRVAETIRGGAGVITYQGTDGLSFWIGDTALIHDGQALPIGPTPQRLSDPRQRAFLTACLVEALHRAGYTPGAYHLALGFAIPNDEMTLDRTDRLGVADDTKMALKQWIRGATLCLTRTDEHGQATDWTLSVQHLIPQAQSIGTFLAWSRTPNGATITDIDALTILDIGGGDLQRTDILLNPYRMTTERLGAGTIGIARALKGRFARLNLADVAAQQALITHTVRQSGRLMDISTEVQTVIDTAGQDVIGRVLPILQQQSRYVILTGGGVLLLGALLRERAAAVGKEDDRDFVLIDAPCASVLNAVGALFAVLFTAGARG